MREEAGAPARPGAPLRVGLTGGIACGKSRVLRTLAARGCATLDLDEVSRTVMAPGGAAFAGVVDLFGSGVLDAGGAIDRRRLAERVFSDRAARSRLETVVHPEIRNEESRRVLEASRGAASESVFVSDGALLVETGSHLRYDRLVVVHTTPERQVARLLARDGLEESAARARIEAQMPAPEKARFGHHRVETSGTLRETDAEAEALASLLLEEASRPVRPLGTAARRLAGCARAAAADGLAAALSEELGAGRHVDLRRLSERARGSPQPEWFLGAPVDGAGADLGPLVALWSLGLRGDDDDYLVGAAYAVGRALGLPPDVHADLCLAALTAARLALGAPNLETALPVLRDRARHWAGSGPSDLVERALRDARSAPERALAAAFAVAKES